VKHCPDVYPNIGAFVSFITCLNPSYVNPCNPECAPRCHHHHCECDCACHQQQTKTKHHGDENQDHHLKAKTTSGGHYVKNKRPATLRNSNIINSNSRTSHYRDSGIDDSCGTLDDSFITDVDYSFSVDTSIAALSEEEKDDTISSTVVSARPSLNNAEDKWYEPNNKQAVVAVVVDEEEYTRNDKQKPMPPTAILRTIVNNNALHEVSYCYRVFSIKCIQAILADTELSGRLLNEHILETRYITTVFEAKTMNDIMKDVQVYNPRPT
jgi:hypothetical protein